MPNLGITGWNIQTISQHGTAEQAERWVGPTLRGEITWCQLFSEPGAGSDAAAIATRGVRVDGGWRVTGQKVWTTGAHQSDWGFATVRTDPSVPKHAGVTMMAIDLRSAGVEVRPLRELTGEALFNEVFFDDVFVPDECVVGAVGQGWRVARATLGNERVSIGGGGAGVLPVRREGPASRWPRRRPTRTSPSARWRRSWSTSWRCGSCCCARRRARSGASSRGRRATCRSSSPASTPSGSPGSRCGSRARAAVTGRNELIMRAYLWARCLTIAGGTSEIARNQVAERILGLPRDPLLR